MYDPVDRTHPRKERFTAMKNAPTIAVMVAVAFIAFAVGYVVGSRSNAVPSAADVALPSTTPAPAEVPITRQPVRAAVATTPAPVTVILGEPEPTPAATPPPRVSETVRFEAPPAPPVSAPPLPQPDPVQIYSVIARAVSWTDTGNYLNVSWQVGVRNVTTEAKSALVVVKLLDQGGFQVAYDNESINLGPGQVTTVSGHMMVGRSDAAKISGVEGLISGFAAVRGSFQ
jgi:hypothetical protein